jgi:mono/diheme cytochrome c family protein
MMTMPVRTLALSLSAIFLLVVVGAKAAEEETANKKNAVINITAAAGDPDQVEKGRELYHSMPCVRCHGGNCVQNSGAAFDLRTFPHDDKARFVNSVTKGKNGRMPPWGDVLKPEEIDQLWAYIQSVGKP